MKAILFVCHGNICRSPMAEFVLKDMLQKRGISDWVVESAATSTEEIGNPVHRGTRTVLAARGISCEGKRARQITSKDYDRFHFLIGMDRYNIQNMQRVFKGDQQKRIHKLLAFAGEGKDVADPWYTGDFETTYQDVVRGCEALLAQLLPQTSTEVEKNDDIG